MLSIFKKDQRRYPRLSCHWAVSVRIGGTAHQAHILNISRGGCQVRPVNPSLFLKAPTAVVSVGGYDLAATMVCRQGRSWRFRFPVALAKDHFDALVATMSRVQVAEEASQTQVATEPAIPALAWLTR